MNYKLRIIIDTREKRNELITEAFDRNNIEYYSEKLDYGDYSGEVVFSDGKKASLRSRVFYERKRELTELSNTIWQGIDRFHRELSLAYLYVDHKKLIIEDSNYYRHILEHDYRTKLPPNVFIDRLFELQNKYKFDIVGVDGELTGSYIYRNMKKYVEDNIDRLYEMAR